MGWGKWAALIGGGIASGITMNPAPFIAATGIASALDQKEAIDKANKQQQAGTSAAQQAITQGYQNAVGGLQQAAAGLQPYQQLGAQSTNALSTLMGFGGTTSPLVSSAPPPSTTDATMPVVMPPSPTESAGHQGLSSLVTDDNATPEMRPSLARAIAARQQNQSSYTGPNVQGPDGRFYRIPEDQIEAALADGGRRL